MSESEKKKEQIRTEVGKRAMISAMRKALGIVTPALKISGVSRTAFYEWLKEDPDFKVAIENVDEVSLDFGETALLKAIKRGNISAIIFFLKTKGKSRGYIEKFILEHTKLSVSQLAQELDKIDSVKEDIEEFEKSEDDQKNED